MVSFVWPTLAIATIPFSWFLFCHIEHCQLTTCSVWHKSLPHHARPCQNMWAPHYAAARDWLKSKGVSALTDRSGVVYCLEVSTRKKSLQAPRLLLHDQNIWKDYVQVLYFAEKILMCSHFEKPRAPIFLNRWPRANVYFVYFYFSSEVNN